MSCCDKASKIVRGVKGLTKAALRVDRADMVDIVARREVCRTCDQSEKRVVAGVVKVRMCASCGCLIAAKTKLKSEQCPLKKWM